MQGAGGLEQMFLGEALGREAIYEHAAVSEKVDNHRPVLALYFYKLRPDSQDAPG